MSLKTRIDSRENLKVRNPERLPCDFCEEWQDVKSHNGYVLCNECIKLFEIRRPQKHERIQLKL